VQNVQSYVAQQPSAHPHDRRLFSPTTHHQSVIELSRTQDEEVGDGTTSVIILGERA
jgi:hypothetical protein